MEEGLTSRGKGGEELLSGSDERLLLSTELDLSSSSSTFGDQFDSLGSLGVYHS